MKNEGLLAASSMDLMTQALQVKLQQRQDSFSLCAILNAKSGLCSENCSFCTQAKHFKTDTPIYPLMSVAEVVKAAKVAKSDGAHRFSLVTSGRGPSAKEVQQFAERISAIKDAVDIKVCGSFGLMGARDLAILQAAGMDRYHHNLEASAEYFPSICSSHSFYDRVATIRAAKEVGLGVCAGGIIGLGEQEVDRLSMANSLAALGVDSVPLNILIPLPGTDMAGHKPLTTLEILRAIAIYRLVLPTVCVRLAAGREQALAEFLSLAFMAGADGMMIGGYLTQQGRTPDQDLAFRANIQELWTK